MSLYFAVTLLFSQNTQSNISFPILFSFVFLSHYILNHEGGKE